MILMVDDEPDILKLYAKFLEIQGYSVLPCSSPSEALEVFQQYQSDIRTVISDYLMPEMTGLELLANLQARSPNIQKIMMTGYCMGHIPSDMAIIQKPFSIKQLLQLLSEREVRSVHSEEGRSEFKVGLNLQMA